MSPRPETLAKGRVAYGMRARGETWRAAAQEVGSPYAASAQSFAHRYALHTGAPWPIAPSYSRASRIAAMAEGERQ